MLNRLQSRVFLKTAVKADFRGTVYCLRGNFLFGHERNIFLHIKMK